MRLCYDEYDVRKFVMGSGGSAYNDGGFGAVRALNIFEFIHQNGKKITLNDPMTFRDV